MNLTLTKVPTEAGTWKRDEDGRPLDSIATQNLLGLLRDKYTSGRPGTDTPAWIYGKRRHTIFFDAALWTKKKVLGMMLSK